MYPDIAQVAFMVGRYRGATEALLDEFHNCGLSHLRYPWPLDRNCPGCRRDLEKHVRRNHMEMAYRLFGWDAMVDSLVLALDLKITQRDARLMQGAFI